MPKQQIVSSLKQDIRHALRQRRHSDRLRLIPGTQPLTFAGFFSAVGQPLPHGRDFAEADRSITSPVHRANSVGPRRALRAD